MATATTKAPATTKTAAEQAVEQAKAAVAANKAKEPSKARKGIDSYEAVFADENAILAEKDKRDSGPQRAFKVTVAKDLKAGTYFVMAHNDHGTGSPLLKKLAGAEIVELGVKARAPRAATSISPEAFTKLKESVTSMSVEQKAELKKQAEELKKLLDSMK